MNMIVVGFFIVFIIFLLSWVIKEPSVNKKRKKSRKLFRGSSGVRDKNSNAARKLIESISPEKRTANDTFIHTQITHLNENDAKTNVDILDGYAATLAKLVEEGNNRPRNPTSQRQRWESTVERNTREHMTDTIDNFVNNFDIMNHYPLMPDEYTDADQDIAMNFIHFAAETIPVVRNQNVEARKKEAAAVTNNDVDRMDYFLKNSKTNTDDPQNSHDVQVNKDLRATYDTIRTTRATTDNTSIYAEIKQWMADTTDIDWTNKKRLDAEKALDKIKSFNREVVILDATEQDVLVAVWNRSKNVRNTDNSDLIKLAVANALADSIENDIMVCSNGTTSRLLSSLATLDYDSSVGNVQKFETIKNMIFDKANIITQEEIDKLALSKSPSDLAIHAHYNDPDEEVNAEALQVFQQQLRTRMDELLAAETRNANLDTHAMDQIRTQLHAAIN